MPTWVRLRRCAAARRRGSGILLQLFLRGASPPRTLGGSLTSSTTPESKPGAAPCTCTDTRAHDMKGQGCSLEDLMSLGGWTTTEMPMRYGRGNKSARAIAANGRVRRLTAERETEGLGTSGRETSAVVHDACRVPPNAGFDNCPLTQLDDFVFNLAVVHRLRFAVHYVHEARSFQLAGFVPPSLRSP